MKVYMLLACGYDYYDAEHPIALYANEDDAKAEQARLEALTIEATAYDEALWAQMEPLTIDERVEANKKLTEEEWAHRLLMAQHEGQTYSIQEWDVK